MPRVRRGATVSRLELAALLRTLRNDAGKSMKQAADVLMCSEAKIFRLETAGRGLSARDVRDLCTLYGVDEATRAELTRLSENSRRRGWWTEFDALDGQCGATYIGLESEASECCVFESLRIPELLQTPRLARVVTSTSEEPDQLSEQTLEGYLEACKRRQERLFSGDLALRVVIDEAAIHRIGSLDTLAEQVERLIEVAQRPNVTLQVIPFKHGPHPGMRDSFEHLRFPAGRIVDVVHVGGSIGHYMSDTAEETNHCLRLFGYLSARFALPVDQTPAWLRRLYVQLDG